MAQDGHTLLQATSLAVGYRRRRVREEIGVELRAGQLVCLLGRNGAGKSTLLRVLAGLEKPLAGSVELRSADGWQNLHTLVPRERARRLGVVLQERADLGLMTARELVNLGRHPHTGWSGRLSTTDQGAVHRALGELGADALAQRAVMSLSDGERQRVMIARALAQEPGIFILDEPTAFLDLPGRVEVLKLLRDLSRGAHRAVLVSTHELDLALRLADQLWVLPEGTGLVSGTPSQLVADGTLASAFASDTASEFLDSILDGAVSEARADGGPVGL